jgi:hypothetical protein
MARPRGRAASIYIAKESGFVEVDGQTLPFTKGVTLVRAGHPILDKAGMFFEPVSGRVHYDVETATAEPHVDDDAE